MPDNNLLSPEEYSLRPTGSFSCYRVKISLEKVLDLRNPNALKRFLEIISQINPSLHILFLAKKLKLTPPKTVKTVERLYKAILAPNYKQWAAELDQPSQSQWLALYVREAGINGIIYPSVRNQDGFNVAVFSDTFSYSDNVVQLIDPASAVKIEDQKIDQNNFRFHQQNEPKTGNVFSH